MVAIVAAAFLALSASDRASAAAERIKSVAPTGASTVTIIPETAAVTVESPFFVTWGVLTYEPTAVADPAAKNIRLFQGQRVATVAVSIKNKTASTYAAQFQVRPAKAEVWPQTELVAITKSMSYRGPVPIGPGKVVDANVEIYIGYGSPNVEFQGLFLDVYPVPDQDLGKG